MLTRKHSIEGKDPFSKAAELFSTLDADSAMKLAMVAGDITLVLDRDGVIVDTAYDPEDFPLCEGWEGTRWIDTVTVESREKIDEMLNAAREGVLQHWRKVNHPSDEGDVPIRYAVLAVKGGENMIAFGRDMREIGRMQQRLLTVQQSLEQDYQRMRQLETRYRLLLEQSREPVIVVESNALRISEANGAAHELMGVREGSLPGKRLATLIEAYSRDDLQALVGAALAAQEVAPRPITLTRASTIVQAHASAFAHDRRQYLMLRFLPEETAEPRRSDDLVELIELMPDGFVVADADLELVSANAAFVELVEAASADQLRGRHLSHWIGRPGIDLELITTQIEQSGLARNVATVIRSHEESDGEPVEISALQSRSESGHYAFLIRPIARRVRDLPPGAQDMPRSVEQLTELVGRMSLRDIVRESTDLIEQLCIEAALEHTSDNRASAAEILGLSRQSLYSKLHRHGIGNLNGEDS